MSGRFSRIDSARDRDGVGSASAGAVCLFADVSLTRNRESGLIRTCAARRLTAAFRSLGQAGSIPSAAQSLNQQDCICHTPTQDIDRGDLIRQGGTLRGDHFEVARDAAFVTRD